VIRKKKVIPKLIKHPPEVALEGWEAIGEMFGKTGRAMCSRKEELINAGVVFYTKQGGPPPRLRVCAFPTMLMRWSCEKAARRERI